MLPESVFDKIQRNMSRPSFFKSLPPGDNWKSKSMRMIPEVFVRNTLGDFEHRVVFKVRWRNSWQVWLEQEKQGLFMVKEDWDEFVDDNYLGQNDTLFFTHQDDMFIEVCIFNKDRKEIMTVPLEPESTQPSPKPQKETTHASASANGGTARQSCGPFNVKSPEDYLLNPNNPYFVRTLTKKNDVLYVKRSVIQDYGLKFGPINSPMTYLLPEGSKEEGWTKYYSGNYAFNGWTNIIRKHNLKQGDSVVCELESSGGVVTAVRLHFMNE